MRLKAIPEEAVSFVAANPLLLAGVAGIAVVGVYYVKTHNSVAPDADVSASTSQPVYGSYGLAPLSTGGIVSSPTVGLGGGSSIVDSVSNGVALQGIQDAKDAVAAALAQSNFDKDLSLKERMFNFEVKKSDDANALAYTQLNANMMIAAMNADIAYQGIQASNYSTSAALAQSFLMSGQQLAMGSVTAPDGSTFNFGFTGFKGDSSKKGKETTHYLQVLQATGFNSFMAEQATKTAIPASPPPVLGVSPGATFGTIGSAAATPYASSVATPPVQSGGSNVVETVNSVDRYDRLPAYKRGLYGNTYDIA